ncbi:hypothetical protein AVEN_138044-1 [Araneus ventricosus]|uniref:Uncharacterized protein n=1 Tax=Araneus ventricosus TaxID=182803 RepID=A0A4Y2MZN3_ARAVE|nr:hypothetical protein AVEN_138044-1 [Araneus ventricosus]
MWHNIYQSQEESNINVIPGFNDGNLQFCHRLKLSAIGIYSPTEDTPTFSWGLRSGERAGHSMTFISFPGGFCNVNGGVVQLESPTWANTSLCKWQ